LLRNVQIIEERKTGTQEEPVEAEQEDSQVVYKLVNNMEHQLLTVPFSDNNYRITVRVTGETRNGIPHGVCYLKSLEDSNPNNRFKGWAVLTTGQLNGGFSQLQDNVGIIRIHSDTKDGKLCGHGSQYYPDTISKIN
jgi:hypothetical protein